MDISSEQGSPEFSELVRQYEGWARVSPRVGLVSPNDPVWENGRLHLRTGYPYDGWTSLIIEPTDNGCNVLRSSTERRIDPVEGLAASFSDIDDAGKYVVWKLGEKIRLAYRLDPVQWAWEKDGLDPRVHQISLSRYVSRFELKANPQRYMILQAGGIRPENRLLPLNYDGLNELLFEGLPELI